MVRGLSSLVLVAAPHLGHAVRQNLKAERVGYGSHLMSSIASVLTSHQQGHHEDVRLKLQALAKETPEVSSDLETIIRTLVDTIEDDVKSLIMQSKQATVDELDKRVTAVVSASTDVTTQYGVAKSADGEYYVCVSEEQQAYEAEETDKQEMDTAQANTVQPCNDKAANKEFSRAAPAQMSVDCDFSVAAEDQNSCESQMQKLDQDVTQSLNDLKKDSGDQVEAWIGFDAECTRTTGIYDGKVTDHQNAIKFREDKQGECLELKPHRSNNICKFGSDVQVKCEKFASYETLISELEETGNAHSQVDRRQEWATTETTRCLLQKHLDTVAENGGILFDAQASEEALQECVTASVFEEQDGDLGLQSFQDKVDAAMGVIDNNVEYKCEPSRKFSFENGLAWQVDTAVEVKSQGYTTVTFTPEIVLDTNQDAFVNPAICSAGEEGPVQVGK